MRIKPTFVRARVLFSARDRPGLLPLTAQTADRHVRSGRFPRPVKLARGVKAWAVDAIERYLTDLTGGPEAAQAFERALLAYANSEGARAHHSVDTTQSHRRRIATATVAEV